SPPTSTTRSRPAERRTARRPRRASSAPPSPRRSRIARSNYSPKEATSERNAEHGPARTDQAERGLQPPERLRGGADGRTNRLGEAARDHYPADAQAGRRRRLHHRRRRAPLPRREGRQAARG